MSQQEYEPKFRVENLGAIREGEFTQKPLTIFCGPNNSGKTWVMYSLYYWSRVLRNPGRLQMSIFDEDEDKIIRLDDLSSRINDNLTDFFNTKEVVMEGAKIDLICSDEQLQYLLGKESEVKNIFLIPAERNGLHLFFQELRSRRTALLHHVSKEKIDIAELLRDVMRSRYARPIANYIDWLNEIPEIMRKGNNEFHGYAEMIKKRLVRGAYNVDKKTGDITFKPHQAKRGGRRTQSMSLHMTSGTVKSLFGLWFYLEYQARKGDLLMIDEPELNIHPANQVEMARLLARLVNAGLRVVFSTHSDYIIRELNSLMMLNQQGSDGMRKKYRYEEEEILDPAKVGAYLFDEQIIEPLGIFTEDGIYATTFNKVIAMQGKSNNDIYYTMQEINDGH